MSVIADVRIPADEFELGRILQVEGVTTITLETMVPLGQKAVPFFSVFDHGREPFESTVREHPTVENLRIVNERDDQTLYALDWIASRDLVFEGFYETDAQLLHATGTSTTWEFELRFPSPEGLSAFQAFCTNAHIPLEVDRIYNPTKPDSGPWFGLTPGQREALTFAVSAGYYSIPRQVSTKDLATELEISDQAVTERLRRAIVALVESTPMVVDRENNDDD